MTLKRTVAANFVLSGGGQLLGVALGLANVGLLTRTLGKEGYGLYTTAFVFLATFAAIINFGLPAALLQMLGRGDHEEERVVGGILLLRIAIALVGFALAPLLVHALFDYPDAVLHLVPIGAVGFFFGYLNSALGSVFQKHLLMGRQVLVTLAERAVFLLWIAVWSVSSGVPFQALVGLALTNALGFAVRLRLAQTVVRVRPRFEPAIWRRALATSWPVGLMTLLGLLCTHGDLLILAEHRSGTEVGTYGLSHRVLSLLVLTIPTQLMTLLLPVLAQAWHRRDLDAFRDHFQAAFDGLALALLPIVAGTWMIADDLAVLLGGPQFRDTGDILRIHILAAAALFVGMLYRYTALALDIQRRLIAPTVVVTATTLAGLLTLVPTHGMHCAAWLRVLHASAGCAATILIVTLTSRHLPHLGVALRAALASLVMVLALLPLRDGHPLAALAVGATTYLLAALALRAIRRHQIHAILVPLRRQAPGR